MQRTLFSTLICALGLTASASASTWIVDDDGGAGVDFATIQAAIDAAAPGDALLVRPGSYAGFTLSKGLTIQGEPGVQVTSAILVHDLPAGPRATLSRMSVATLDLASCFATVIGDDLVAQAAENVVYIDYCADVRLRRLYALAAAMGGTNPYPAPTLVARTSRVEITDSVIQGYSGNDATYWNGVGGNGGEGVHLGVGANIHISASTVVGGNGGDVYLGSDMGHGGNGAIAVRVGSSSARLLVTGFAGDVLQGGAQGRGGGSCYTFGTDAPAVRLSGGEARLSNIAVLGRVGYCGEITPPIVQNGGVLDLPSPADPALSLSAPTQHGTPVTFTLTGNPGASARLRIGRQPTVVDLPAAFEDRLLVPLRTYDLGVLPASGLATFQFNLPAALPPGFLIVAQGSTVDAGGTSMTQSVPIVLY